MFEFLLHCSCLYDRGRFLKIPCRPNQCDQIGLVPAPRAVFRIWRAGKIWRIHYIGAGFRLRWGWFSKNRMQCWAGFQTKWGRFAEKRLVTLTADKNLKKLVHFCLLGLHFNPSFLRMSGLNNAFTRSFSGGLCKVLSKQGHIPPSSRTISTLKNVPFAK